MLLEMIVCWMSENEEGREDCGEYERRVNTRLGILALTDSEVSQDGLE